MANPIGPDWIGDMYLGIWPFLTLLVALMLLYNKPFKTLYFTPLAEKGDVDPRAAIKGWFLSSFPLFNILAGVAGLGVSSFGAEPDDAFSAEPNLHRYLLWFLFPAGLSTMPLHLLINYRRKMRLRAADSTTLVTCTVGQTVYLTGTGAWAYYSIVASQAGGTLSPHATRVRVAVGCVLISCTLVVASMVYRSAVLMYAVWSKRALLPGVTVKTYFERLYLGASPSAEGIISYSSKTTAAGVKSTKAAPGAARLY